MVRVAREAVEHVRAHPVIAVPRVARPDRHAGLAHQAVVGEVVLDLQQLLAEERDQHPDGKPGATGEGDGGDRRHEVLQAAAQERARQRVPHRLAEFREPGLLHLERVDV